MSIRNRLNRFIKEQRKKARKAFIRRQGVLAQKPQEGKQPRTIKRRGHDYTLRY